MRAHRQSTWSARVPSVMGQHQRKVIPGTTYLITRRCSERRFYLRPDAATTCIIAYCPARAARMTGVKVHAVGVPPAPRANLVHPELNLVHPEHNLVHPEHNLVP